MVNVLFDALLGMRHESAAQFLRLPGDDSISYRSFYEQVSRYAHALVAHGVQPGDRVTVQVEKSPHALALYFATVGVGAVYSPLNTEYTVGEIEYFVQDAEPSLVVCTPASAHDVRLIAKKAGASVATLGSDGSGSLGDTARGQANAFVPANREQGDAAAILYTSGTTGRSKGAMLTHGNLLSNAATLKEAWAFTEDDVLLHALPIFHAHGLFVANNTVALAGGSMIFHPRFIVDHVIRDLPAATSFMAIPTFYTRLLADERLTPEIVGDVRLFVSGSASLLAETHLAFERRTGHKILERYGMTETTMITSNPYDGFRKAGTVGRPLPGISVRICDAETGKEVPPGEIGALEVAGPNVFKGYWRMPEKTASEFRADGYFMTGDLARIDADGYITLVGRAKDLIISGGYNVYPKEIELLVDELDGVVESAVVGVPHPDFGEAVVAAVVVDPKKITAADSLMPLLKGKVAKYKQPKRYFIEDRLPRNALGKVQKTLLREKYRQCFT
ncbi:malonyl-CoA synthase [Mesorhizobium sp. L2C084A000]|uniref:malonate--CoA ligase n=1 Tax=Mesorhizobium sp. L2C084A000 TaxID=1287116 RepID=UPI0003D04F95|nr:malonyl-CoA synthase [Mesorhizobium sp. L2C084A000]ESZ19326.1 malonyl-CoA synthase [Mesorhizobium sp. L2C084A000]